MEVGGPRTDQKGGFPGAEQERPRMRTNRMLWLPYLRQRAAKLMGGADFEYPMGSVMDKSPTPNDLPFNKALSSSWPVLRQVLQAGDASQ